MAGVLSDQRCVGGVAVVDGDVIAAGIIARPGHRDAVLHAWPALEVDLGKHEGDALVCSRVDLHPAVQVVPVAERTVGAVATGGDLRRGQVVIDAVYARVRLVVVDGARRQRDGRRGCIADVDIRVVMQRLRPPLDRASRRCATHNTLHVVHSSDRVERTERHERGHAPDHRLSHPPLRQNSTR